MQTLKKTIKQLHEGNDLALNSLVTFRVVQELNNQGDLDDIQHLSFTSKGLQDVYTSLRNDYPWIKRQDFEAIFLDGLVRDTDKDKGLLYQLDINYADKQIKTYLFSKLRGHILNEVSKLDTYDSNILYDSKTLSYDDVEQSATMYDDISFKEWQQLEVDDTYSKFLDNIGGLDKILTKQQYKIYHMAKEQNATQEQIAKELSVSQQTISKTIKAADKRIKKEYMTFRTYQTITKQNGKVYDEITTFRKSIDKIVEFDVSDTFDYFGFVVNWILEHYKDEGVNYSKLHKNLKDDTMSIYDVLVDNISKAQRELFYNVFSVHVYKTISKDKIKFTKREKDRFVYNVIKILDDYVKNVDEAIKSMSDTFVDEAIEDVDTFAKIFK